MGSGDVRKLVADVDAREGPQKRAAGAGTGGCRLEAGPVLARGGVVYEARSENLQTAPGSPLRFHRVDERVDERLVVAQVEVGAAGDPWVSAVEHERLHPAGITRREERGGRRAGRDPEHDGALRPGRVEHGVHVVDPVVGLDVLRTVGEPHASLVEENQAG